MKPQDDVKAVSVRAAFFTTAKPEHLADLGLSVETKGAWNRLLSDGITDVKGRKAVGRGKKVTYLEKATLRPSATTYSTL